MPKPFRHRQWVKNLGNLQLAIQSKEKGLDVHEENQYIAISALWTLTTSGEGSDFIPNHFLTGLM
jgi:hypothetical protein